jgi:hypothetical protein
VTLPPAPAQPTRHPETVSLRLTADDFNLLGELAWHHHLQRSVMARQLLVRAIAAEHERVEAEKTTKVFS